MTESTKDPIARPANDQTRRFPPLAQQVQEFSAGRARGVGWTEKRQGASCWTFPNLASEHTARRLALIFDDCSVLPARCRHLISPYRAYGDETAPAFLSRRFLNASMRFVPRRVHKPVPLPHIRRTKHDFELKSRDALFGVPRTRAIPFNPRGRSWAVHPLRPGGADMAGIKSARLCPARTPTALRGALRCGIAGSLASFCNHPRFSAPRILTSGSVAPTDPNTDAEILLPFVFSWRMRITMNRLRPLPLPSVHLAKITSPPVRLVLYLVRRALKA